MILLDNLIFELQRLGGVSKYWSKTIEQIDSYDKDLVFLEGRAVNNNIFRTEISLIHPILRDTGPAELRRIICPRRRADVFHSSYYRIAPNARANVVTIHDFMNEKFPQGCRDLLLAFLKRRACLSADAIVVVSQQTRKDLLKYYPFVDAGRVHVTYNGVDEEFYPEPLEVPFWAGSESLSPRGYFLYVGSRGFCKNFPFVLRFVAEAWLQGLKLPLIIVGGGKLSDQEWAKAKAFGLPPSAVRQISDVSNVQLRRLYSNCISLLIPSIYEGFGLPAAEAARCGALVLAARGSALDEIVGETDYSFDLAQDWEPARVLRLGLNGKQADGERARMKARSAIFDWNASAAKLMEIYDEL